MTGWPADPNTAREARGATHSTPRDAATDRLAELRGGGAAPDLEMGSTSAAGAGATASAFMTAFFEEVQGVKKVMGTIRSNISRIEQLHGEALSAISSEQGKAATAALEAETKRTNSMAQQVRAQLKSMDGANKEFSTKSPGASEARIRVNMHSTLTRKFVELMAEYQEVQTKYKNKCECQPPRPSPRLNEQL